PVRHNGNLPSFRSLHRRSRRVCSDRGSIRTAGCSHVFYVRKRRKYREHAHPAQAAADRPFRPQQRQTRPILALSRSAHPVIIAHLRPVPSPAPRRLLMRMEPRWLFVLLVAFLGTGCSSSSSPESEEQPPEAPSPQAAPSPPPPTLDVPIDVSLALLLTR